MRRTILGMSLLLILAVAGCGSSAPAGSAGAGASVGAATQAPEGSGPDPCSLLSKAEVESAVGHPVDEGVPDIVNSCLWDSTPGSTSLHLLWLGNAKCAVNAADRTPVSGLSVPASWRFIPAGTTGSIVACTKGWQLQVTMVGDIVNHTPPEATLRDQATQLMGLVLSRF